jgi:hypothetical protein
MAIVDNFRPIARGVLIHVSGDQDSEILDEGWTWNSSEGRIQSS